MDISIQVSGAGLLRRRLVVMFLATTTVYCGSKNASVDDRRSTVTRPVVTQVAPAGYAFDDTECQNDAGAAVKVTKSTIYAWDGPQVVEREVSFRATTSERSLTSEAVGETLAGIVYQRSCPASDLARKRCSDDEGREKPWPVTDPGRPLKICRNQHRYARQSVEGIALTSLYFLQEARDLYLSVTARDKSAAPVQVDLSVLPAFISDYPNVKKGDQEVTVRNYSTDNLAYFPGAQVIAVFPVLAEEKTAWKGFYWESAFVLGHEYGHHIDFTRHGRVLAAVGLQWNPLTHGFDDLDAVSLGVSSATERAQIAGAEAEAFADLLGYYAAGADGRSIDDLPRIGKDRNVGNAFFEKGAAKILTSDRLELLLGRGDPTKPSAFRDIHTAGAIIAYTLNQVLLQLTAATTTHPAGSQEEIAERYYLALRFMDALVKSSAALTASDSGSQVLTPVSQAISSVVSEALTSRGSALREGQASNEAVTTAVCQLTAKHLPALVPLPFAVGGLCG